MSDGSGRPVSRIGREFNLFASEHFVITTYLDDTDIHERLKEVVAPYSILTFFFRYFFNRKQYIGKISPDGFRVEHIFPDGGAPIVTGRFWNDGEHTLIEMTIKQQWWNILRMYAGLAMCMVYIILSLTGMLIPRFSAEFVLIVFVALAGVFVMIPMYTREIGRSRRFFRELLEDIEPG